MCNENYVPSISDLIRDCQYENNSLHLTQAMTECEWFCNTNLPSLNDATNKNRNIKEEIFDEDSNDSLISVQEQPPTSLFKETNCRKRPWLKKFTVTGNYFPLNRDYLIKNTHIYIHTS